MVNKRGNHGLSCKRSAGRTLRHNYQNKLIYHALLQAGLLSIKEPAGLVRTDGKRPDGFTNMPRQVGKLAVWDITVADTLVDSYIVSTVTISAATAELAITRKEAKYVKLSTTNHSVPLAFKSMGPIGSKAMNFLKELDRRLTPATDSSLQIACLFQHLSVALQRFNAMCILGCFGGKQEEVD